MALDTIGDQTRDLVEAAACARDHADAALAAARTRAGSDPTAWVSADQQASHGLAWIATYAETLTQTEGWLSRIEPREIDRLCAVALAGEYLAQMRGGIPMSQGEMARPADLGLDASALENPAVDRLIAAAPEARLALAALLGEGQETDPGLDEEMAMVAEQFRRWSDERIAPHAHGWHLRDELIPMEVIEEMAGMGVFGLTIPEEHGGLGLPKLAMCVVSEELSRGYIGVGSLGTRSEIAAELILGGGTEAQKARWLPALASGETLPTAVFTEPGTGSDLGALRTKAVRGDEGWTITGAKTWITHAARTSLMTVLARTEADTDDHRGLSMFLAEKIPGTDAEPFPDEGLSGGEIEVLGYRGMKEYTLSFDSYAVPEDALLGGVTGKGFRQLMRTFESARIQTAARAVGVARSALDASLRYAQERRAFGESLTRFGRVAAKLGMMAAEIEGARQLTYFSAREKDGGQRCDLQAGMAKLLAARVAWAAADGGVQIHGGNGFALEYPVSRILCDARILSIFEGAAEIQAQVIARRLLA